MITITIKGLSREAHRELKRRAAAYGRSLNTEAIAVLEASVRATPVNPQDMLQRLRVMRPKLKFRITATEINRSQRGGRI